MSRNAIIHVLFPTAVIVLVPVYLFQVFQNIQFSKGGSILIAMSLSTDSREDLSTSSKPVQESDQAGQFNQFVNFKSRFVVSFGYRVFVKDLLRFSILTRELWTAVNHSYDHKQRALKQKNTKRIEIHQSQITKHELWTPWNKVSVS